MKKKIPWFTLVLCLTIGVLSFLATRISSHIVITTIEQRISLTNAFQNKLQDNAIFRARTLDPEAKWLSTTEADETVRAYIEENLASLIRLNGDQMSKDSNLAWVIQYNGQEYRHNWKESYDQQTGAIDYTIRSSDDKISYSGAIQPDAPFSRKLTILVNPSIVPEERLNSSKGSEYTYSLTLPDGFSIRYYVPSVIESNGGEIARVACQLDLPHWDFCVLAASGILIALVVCWPWNQEKNLSLLVRFRKIKGLFAFLILSLGITGLGVALSSLSTMNADGTLALMFHSFGMTMPQSYFGAASICMGMWAIFLGVIALTFLYCKSIFKMGVLNYLANDTLTATIFKAGQNELLEAFTNPRSSKAGLRLILTSMIVTFAFSAILVLGIVFFGPVGLLFAFFFGTILLAVFFWSLFKHMNQSFAKVYDASEQLAKGNFSALPPQSVGYYQPLYDELVHVSDSYQSALKEGLASQVSKTQLISNVSHDLKTPVAGIQSYSELITLSDNMDDIHSYAKRLNQYAIRLNDLIVDLFDVAKATSGDIQLDLMEIDLSELVMQVSTEWDDIFQGKGLKMVLNLQPQAMLRLDPGKMVRVMENLLSNISKYSLENSRVFIDLKAQDGLYQLVLKNTSSTEMNFNPENIVERFVRGDASRHEAGSGLGLAIVKSFVEVQQGTFEVQTDGDLFKAYISFAIPPIKHSNDEKADLSSVPFSFNASSNQQLESINSLEEVPEKTPSFERIEKTQTSRVEEVEVESDEIISSSIPQSLPKVPEETEEKGQEIKNEEEDLLFKLSMNSAKQTSLEDPLWDLSSISSTPTLSQEGLPPTPNSSLEPLLEENDSL